MDLIEQFEKEVKERIDANANDEELKRLAAEWMRASMLKKYAYNFSWLGRPIIQTPQDIVALQEITWKAKPDFIVDAGILPHAEPSTVVDLSGRTPRILRQGAVRADKIIPFL